MKQIKKSLALVVFLTSALCFSQKKWTLQECVDYAIEHNITIKKGENVLLINNQDIKASKGDFLPSLNANIGHNLGIGTQRIDIGQTQVVVDRTSNVTNMGVGINQTIFNGFRLTNIYKQSQLNLETNKLELNRIKDDISLNVANAYLNVLFNKERLGMAIFQYDFSTKQLKQVKDLVDAGVQPKVNIYDAEATLAADEQAVTIAGNNYTLSLLSLSQLLQLPFEGFDIETIEVSDPSETLMYNSISPILNYALDNRNEIKVAEKNIENSELNTKISESGYYPSLTFNYGFGSSAFFSNLSDTEDSYFKQINDQKSHSFSLNLNIPIFSRFLNKTNVAKSKIREDNAKLDLEQSKQDLESNIQRAYTDAQAALKAYEAAKKSVESQNISFNNSKERYIIGVMTSFELEQARVRLINAQSFLINAKYDFVFKSKVLDFYMGKPLTN